MQAILDFYLQMPVLALVTVASIYYTVKYLFFVLPIEAMKQMNIWKHGYPPYPQKDTKDEE